MARFAEGGVIPARFSHADEVPAMLSPGEDYVTPVRFAAPDVAARLAASLDEQAGTMTTGDDGDWTCSRCNRGQCSRCADTDCRCCAGTPGDLPRLPGG